MKQRPKSKSILYSLSATVLLIVLLYISITACALISSGVVVHMEDNAYQLFFKTVSNRKSYIEGEMHNRWSKISDFAHRISSYYPEDITEGTEISEEQVLEFLDKSTMDLISMLRDSGTTGAFVILNDNVSPNSAHSALYFIEGDPSLNDYYNNSDLMILKGPLEFLNKYKIPLHMSWNYGITLTEDNKDIFYKPYEAAQRLGSSEHLGYWHISKSLYDENAQVITYTQPLLNSKGVAFGVLGIEVSQEFFYHSLPRNELSEEGFSGYALATKDEHGNIIPIMVRNYSMETQIPAKIPINLIESNSKYNGYRMISENSVNLAVNFQEIALYNKNTPFDEFQWYLLGAVEEDLLLSNVSKINRAFVFTIIFSLALGLGLSYILGYVGVRPIINMYKRIKEVKPGEKVNLGKIGITEIDELSGAIEQFSEDLFNSIAKTDTIISVVNMEIGTYEYSAARKVVLVSQIFANMLKIPLGNKETAYIEVHPDDFSNMMLNLDREKKDDIYQYNENPPKWFKLEYVVTDTGQFGVAVDVTEDVLAKRAIMIERDYDILTGIYNRYSFQRELGILFKKRKFTRAAFVMSDLDNLKYINDIYGHDVGDTYIKTVADLLYKYFMGKSAIFGRMSGDEFYMFIHGYSSEEEIRKIIYDFYIELHKGYIMLPDGGKFRLKVSSGVSWYNKDSTQPEELIRFADFAMYQGKHSVKGGIREFDANVYHSDSYMLTGKEELYSILDEQFMDYEFQPIIWANSYKIFGYEALMRPRGKTINSPDKLLHLAQAQGQLWKIEKNTFYRVLELYKEYSNLFTGAKVFINSVPNQVLKDEEYEELQRLYGDFLHNIVIEITESERIDDISLNKKKELVIKWDAMLALDDYGAGYANDMMLLNVKPDIIKVDRFIIDGIETDIDKQSILSRTVGFAKERNIYVLAEGVETREQLDMVKKLGVDLVQGYFVSRPKPLSQIHMDFEQGNSFQG